MRPIQPHALHVTNLELHALFDACIEMQAGDMEHWTDDQIAALESVTDKIRTEFHRRKLAPVAFGTTGHPPTEAPKDDA